MYKCLSVFYRSIAHNIMSNDVCPFVRVSGCYQNEQALLISMTVT